MAIQTRGLLEMKKNVLKKTSIPVPRTILIRA
jgi:hypothetical protein